ncbi:MAG: type I phosphomannose isomerase catalytic subunit [Bacteroidales bacterium]
MKLYPLKFKPILKEIAWGGNKLAHYYNKNASVDKNIGESWELSGVKTSLSVVTNGYLKGNNIQELIEIYMGELVGEHVYRKFGIEFPLLIKLIDANDTLSVQVHPDDATAKKRHSAYGKTEMWHILNADSNAKLALGFKKKTDLTDLLEHIESNTVEELLNFEEVYPGETFFVPAGCIHAIGKGIVVAEIQQTSDITYRIYDWGRNLENRPLHIDLAMDVIDYNAKQEKKIHIASENNQTTPLVECNYFTTNLLTYTKTVVRDMTAFDSFVIYLCTHGSAKIICQDHIEAVNIGETILIPSSIANIQIEPEKDVKLLEVYIK